MTQHTHHKHCTHDLKFCDKCDRPYCTKCDKEWFEQSFNWKWYQNAGQTAYTAPATSGYIQTSGNYSVSPLKEMVQIDPAPTACAHS